MCTYIAEEGAILKIVGKLNIVEKVVWFPFVVNLKGYVILKGIKILLNTKTLWYDLLYIRHYKHDYEYIKYIYLLP